MANLLFEVEDTGIEEQTRFEKADIVVIGVGGGGGNTVDTLISKGAEDIRYMVANTDAQALRHKKAANKIQLGFELTKGLGAGADPEQGRAAAELSEDEIRSFVQNADMVFVTAGMGGGTGTGAAPIVARAAKDSGALTVGIVTKPFDFEGGPRMERALEGLKRLEAECDTVLVIPNNKILELAGKDMPFKQAFKLTDQVLYHAISGITTLINTNGNMNADFADVKRVMGDGGKAIIGAAVCAGENRAREAFEQAVHSPLLEDNDIAGASRILINLCGHPEDMNISDIQDFRAMMESMVNVQETDIIIGFGEDESMSGRVSCMVIAAGYDRPKLSGFQSNASFTGSAPGYGSQSISDFNQPAPGTIMQPADPNGDEYDVPAYVRLAQSKGNTYR